MGGWSAALAVVALGGLLAAAGALPSTAPKKILRTSLPTTAPTDRYQHFAPAPNAHLPDVMSYEEFHRYYVAQDAAVHTAHDPTHEAGRKR
jgi:hypothetical protein